MDRETYYYQRTLLANQLISNILESLRTTVKEDLNDEDKVKLRNFMTKITDYTGIYYDTLENLKLSYK